MPLFSSAIVVLIPTIVLFFIYVSHHSYLSTHTYTGTVQLILEECKVIHYFSSCYKSVLRISFLLGPSFMTVLRHLM